MIEKGDLVMVVRPTSCCGSTKDLGSIFIVEKVVYDAAYCNYCNKYFPPHRLVVNGHDGNVESMSDVRKLPPADLEIELPPQLVEV